MAMHGILALVLFLTLSAKTGVESKPTPTQKGGGRSLAKPDWAGDMPPESTMDYGKELLRRMAEGQIVHVRSVARSFLPVALSSLDRDLSPGVHVSGTTVEVVSPAKFRGLQLLIHHQTPPDVKSCWRAPGCRIEFDFHDRQLEAEQVKLPGVHLIYDGDLKNVTLGSPPSKKATTPSGGKDAGP
jgi:hypothetical protein